MNNIFFSVYVCLSRIHRVKEKKRIHNIPSNTCNIDNECQNKTIVCLSLLSLSWMIDRKKMNKKAGQLLDDKRLIECNEFDFFSSYFFFSFTHTQPFPIASHYQYLMLSFSPSSSPSSPPSLCWFKVHTHTSDICWLY